MYIHVLMSVVMLNVHVHTTQGAGGYRPQEFSQAQEVSFDSTLYTN